MIGRSLQDVPGDVLPPYGTNRLRSVTLDGGDWQRGAGGLLLPPSVPRARALYGPQPIGIDLFAGAGGFSLGFHQAGWNVVTAAEWDAQAAITYLHNLGADRVHLHFVTPDDERRLDRAVRQTWNAEKRRRGVATSYAGGNRRAVLGEHAVGCQHFWFGDLSQVSGQDMLDALGLEPGDVDAVFGGPPCQGFSAASAKSYAEKMKDPRNELVFHFARLITEIRPKTFVMENVPTLASMRTPDGALVLDVFASILDEGGWGTYETVKKTLLHQAGVAVAWRPERRNKRGGAVDQQAPPPANRAERRKADREQRRAARRRDGAPAADTRMGDQLELFSAEAAAA